MFNPFHVAFDYTTLCISVEEFYNIFAHDLGADCLPNTADDPRSELNPEIVNVATADECAEGTAFNQVACACFIPELNRCNVNCAQRFPGTPVQNPLEPCECISTNAFNSIFNHGLDGNCLPPDTSGDGTEDPDQGGDSGTGGGNSGGND